MPASEMTDNRPAPASHPPTQPYPILIGVRELARLLNRSVASLQRDDAAGRLPAAVRIGASKRWRLSEIAAWVLAGCPHRTAWDATTCSEV